MIDASRLGHSLATALKDRPHGIPVQPNRSLPLRPPPPPPARISVSKSPKSSSLTPSPSPTPEIQKSKDICDKRSSVDGDCAKDGNLRIDNDSLLTNLGVMGMNFYDSQEKDDDSRKKHDQYRHSKSLDHEESDETNSGDIRRRSCDSEIISRHKKRKSLNSDLTSPETTPPKEKKRRGSYAKKRKLSSDDNSDGSRNEKSPKAPKIARKSITNNSNRVESSGIGLPTIYRSRMTSYTPIRPKLPPGVPECPAAIPIEVAQAINQNGSTSPKKNVETNGTDAQPKPRIPKIRIIQKGRRFSQQIEDVENTLPSMPSLDLDSQSDILNGRNGEKAARELVPNEEAKVSRVTKELSSKTNCRTVQEDLNSVEDKIDQTFSDVLAATQPVIRINISYSKDGIVMTLPEIVTKENAGDAIEATSPETISSSIQNGEQIGQNDVSHSEDATAELLDTSGTSESEISGDDESMVDETDEIRKDSRQVRSKVDVVKVKSRIQLKLAKLQKLYKEKRHLEIKIEQTTDPSRLTRLQQRKNLNEKKIENYEKQLERNRSNIETPSISENRPQLRIQVRQDLVDTTSTENVEPVRRSPFVPCVEDDESPVANSPRVSYPPVITISDNETDTASSDEEGYVIDERIFDNVKPTNQTDPDVKIEMKHVPTNHVEHDSSLSPKDDYRADPLIPPDVRVEPETMIRESIPFIDDLVPSNKESEITNNNVEYTDKNLQTIGIEALKGLPPLIRDPIINYSVKVTAAVQKSPSAEYRPQNSNSVIESFDKNQMTGVAEMKSPNADYRALNKVNSGPRRFDGVNPKCACKDCLQSGTSVSVQSQSQASSKDVNNYIPTPVILNQTVNQENLNSQPVTNYPGHQTDYRTQGNATSMFSRDNGGANINLSSPLQGNLPAPGLPLPPYSQRNLTAQGYPVPGEHSPNYQTTQQWYNQHPGTKLPAPFTPDQDGATHPSILAAHLLRSQAQEPANVSRPSNKPSLTEQFPTLGKWVAENNPVLRKPVDKTTSPKTKPHPIIKQTTGSDMYKMTASAVDARHPAAGTANGLHWQQNRLWTEQQRPPPAYPAPRNNPPLYRPNYQQASPHNAQNTYIATPGSQGPMYVQYTTQPYRPTSSLPQGNRNTEYSAAVTQKKQLAYYQTAPSIQQPVPVSYHNQGQVSSGHSINSLALMQNNYIPQAQYTSQGANQQWMASNYTRQQYLNSQYNGYGIQAKPTDNSVRYARAIQPNKNCAPVIVAHETAQRREQMAQSLQMSQDGYIDRVIQPNRVVQDGLNEPLDLGRSSTIPQSTSRLNNIKCSLCGTSDPKFNCTECGAAFYCNRNCQAQHWRTHFLQCTKKLPKLGKVS